MIVVLYYSPYRLTELTELTPEDLIFNNRINDLIKKYIFTSISLFLPPSPLFSFPPPTLSVGLKV